MSELTDYAKRLTTRRADGSLLVVGFNPLFGFYENTVSQFGHQFGARWFSPTGDSSVADDPAWAAMLGWQKELVDWYGLENLRAFGREVGEEFSIGNAFEKGRLALSLDGEWRGGVLAAHGPPPQIGSPAPPPVHGRAPPFRLPPHHVTERLVAHAARRGDDAGEGVQLRCP